MTLTDDLASVPLFQSLTPEQLAQVASISTRRRFPSGEGIVRQSDPARFVFVVLSGRVKMHKISFEGREQTLYIFGPGDPFCLRSAFQGEPFPADVSALDESEILLIRGDELKNMARQDPDLMFNMLMVLSSRLNESMRMVEDLSLKGVPQRLASFLLHSAALKCAGNESEIFELCITHRELAKILGTTPATLSRVITKLNEDGIIRSQGRTIAIIDRQALVRL
ncbi:MAG: Crp/Fnr family transcriptional regulator, partial [Desulfovibrionales bacterium]